MTKKILTCLMIIFGICFVMKCLSIIDSNKYNHKYRNMVSNDSFRVDFEKRFQSGIDAAFSDNDEMASNSRFKLNYELRQYFNENIDINYKEKNSNHAIKIYVKNKCIMYGNFKEYHIAMQFILHDEKIEYSRDRFSLVDVER